jgi:hypothetical protein
MRTREETAVAKAEQAAVRTLETELGRRVRHHEAGLVEVVEMCDARVVDALETWLSATQQRMTLACLGISNRPGIAGRG